MKKQSSLALTEEAVRQLVADSVVDFDEFKGSCRGTLVDGKRLWGATEVLETVKLLKDPNRVIIKLP